jgi:2-oxoglutarate dehydrogenase E2 component (dihydrolipoamide succinyltransferase)
MATEVRIPQLGESIKQAVLLKWHKTDGQSVAIDDPLAELETDKANVDVRSPSNGVLKRVSKEGQTVAVDEVIAQIDESATATATAAPAAPARQVVQSAAPPSPTPAPVAPPSEAKLDGLSPAVRALVVENNLDPKLIPATGPGGRLTKQDVEAFLANRAAKSAPTKQAPAPAAPPPMPTAPTAPAPAPAASKPATKPAASGTRREPMSKIRKRIAQTMVEAQHTAAILTTFNEIDMTQVMDLRSRYKERFQEVHGVGLGLMSFFARAVVLALRDFPRVNGSIEGDEVVFHDYVNLGIAVSTERGLAVPVLRNVENMGLAKIELEIKRLANATREGKLNIEELSGATFTITNGGVFGSLLSTPILTPPQSGILGMHAIQKRPMVVNDKIEIRNMMYVALSYDHRLVDGRESVSFLVHIKQLIEEPSRLMLEI